MRRKFLFSYSAPWRQGKRENNLRLSAQPQNEWFGVIPFPRGMGEGNRDKSFDRQDLGSAGFLTGQSTKIRGIRSEFPAFDAEERTK